MTNKKSLKNDKNFGVKWDLIRSIMKKSDDYHEKYVKIKFDSDDDFPLNNTIEDYIIGLFFMKIKNIICKFS